MSAALPRLNPEFLQRPRLLARLDEWAPMTVLLAPSGTGKAVLAVQWAHHARGAGHDVIWLDGEVDEPADVVAALVRHAGVEPGPDDATTLRRLRRDLQGLDRRVAVVVNNAEPVLATIGDALTEIVRDCTEVHLVVGLRRRLDPVAKALLETEARVIGLADLQLTVEEVIELAAARGVRLSFEEAREIRSSVNGWAALVRTGFGGAGRWSRRHVEWFLTHNVVPQLPPTAWDAVCRVALVAQPTYRSVLAATGPLDEVTTAVLEVMGVLDPVVGSDPRVHFPEVIRDFFAERYDEASLGPAAELHDRVVAGWLEAGEPAPALRQAVVGARWASAVRIVDDDFWTLVARDPRQVAADLVAIPAAAFAGHPRAQVARETVLPAEPAPVAAVDPEDPDLLALLLARDRRHGRIEEALRNAEHAEALLARVHPGPLAAAPPALRHVALQAGTTRLLAGDLTAADRDLAWAVQEPTDDHLVGRFAAGRLALAAVTRGDRLAGARWAERWRDAGGADPAGRAAAVLHGLQGLGAGGGPAAADLAATVRVDDELWPFAVWARTEHALLRGGRTRLRAELAALRDHPGGRSRTPWTASLVTACEADLCTSLGRTAAAAALLDGAGPGSSYLTLARARHHVVAGEAERAVGLLDGLLGRVRTTTLARVEGLALLAWAAGTPAAAASALREAVEQARAERLLSPFARVPRDLLRRHVDLPSLRPVLTALDESGVREPFAPAETVAVLTPRERAVLRCLARGLSLEQAARELVVSRNTVKSQTAALYRKLGTSGRAEMLARARRLGLVED